MSRDFRIFLSGIFILDRTIRYRLFLLHLCLLQLATAILAQYRFENLTEADGLSDNRVTCFLKDKTGFMWIGTQNGLNRFDGYSFVQYKPGIPGRSLSHPFVNDIEQDQSGRLWVATKGGLTMIDPLTDSMVLFMPKKDPHTSRPVSIPSDLIWDIYIDPSGRIWMAADYRDLCYYDPVQKKFVYYPWKEEVARSFPQLVSPYFSIIKMGYKSRDELWLGTTIGLFSFSVATARFTYHAAGQKNQFVQLQNDSGNKKLYFIQGFSDSLQVLDITSGQCSSAPVPSGYTTTLKNTASGKIWLPAGKGVLEVDTKTGQTGMISHRIDDLNSLPAGNISATYRDDHGLVWVATDKGAGRFNPDLNLFSFVSVVPGLPETIIEKEPIYTRGPVYMVLYSRYDSSYYISSPQTNSLYILDKTTGMFQRIRSVAGTALTNCSVLFEDSKGLLWILAGQTAICWNRREKKWHTVSFSVKKENFLFTDMTEDSQGNFWFSSMYEGLFCYNPVQQKLYHPDTADGFKPKMVTSLYFDRKRNGLWIGTFGMGLYRLDLASRQFIYYAQENMYAGHLHSSMITDITGDANGRIWVATYSGGIAVYSGTSSKNEKFTVLSGENGLVENSILGIQYDGRRNIWANSMKGIISIDTSGKKITTYNQDLGLVSNNFFNPISVTKEGELLTALQDGFTRFHADSMQYSSSRFPVAIIAAITRSGHSLLPPAEESNADVLYTDNEIRFDFAALTYFLPAKTTYQYRLDGADKDWIAGGNSHSVRYANLAPGTYTFRVRAVDFTGRLSHNEASISFRIRPPWWQTWWFLSAVILTIFGMAWWLFRKRIATIKAKAAVRHQIAEIKAEALRAQMNPHFIFNSLNAIQELIITENYTSSYEYLSKFSRLLRMVLHNSEKNLIPLSHEIEMCRLYLELESLRFKHSFHYTIEIEERIDPDSILFPCLLLQPFIENAIWHGLLPKEGEKKLAISFNEEKGCLICLITDNGVGREKAAAIKAGKMGMQHTPSKGIGLVQQRLEALKTAGASIALVEIEDHKTPDGTTVRIILSTFQA